jgi:hypothetical protein
MHYYFQALATCSLLFEHIQSFLIEGCRSICELKLHILMIVQMRYTSTVRPSVKAFATQLPFAQSPQAPATVYKALLSNVVNAEDRERAQKGGKKKRIVRGSITNCSP